MMAAAPDANGGVAAIPQHQNYKWNQDLQFAPLRSINEFVLDQSRYALPSFRDLPKWNNRICANLLYYQSNYMAFMLILVALTIGIQTKAMLVGLLILFMSGVVGVSYVSQDHTLSCARKEHPYAVLFCGVAVGFAAIANLHFVIIALFSIAFPLLVILLHASVRLRNLKNKVNQMFLESVRSTVMAKILYALNIHAQDI